MGLHYTKLEEMARSAVILRISIAKRHVAAGTNSPSTTNEKRKTYAYRNLLKRKRLQPEHKAPKRYIEVGINDSTGYKLPISLSTAAAYISPPQRIPRSEEVESRGWRRGAPQSPSSSSFGAPQGNNKIYKSDEVFLIEKAKRNDQSQTQFPYKITKDISQTQFGRQTASQIGKGNQPTASRSTCPQVRASRAARYWMPRHPRTCRAIT